MRSMRTGTLVLLLGVVAATSGCSTFQNGYERLYQMLDTREQLTRQPPPKASDAGSSMSYSQYQTERRKIIDEKPTK